MKQKHIRWSAVFDRISMVIIAATAMILTSCLGSDKNSDITYYNDTAITGFTLGTMNRYLHTTSKAGTDSIYKRTYKGSDYKFTINQTTGEIFNIDSLPVNTDAEHVICAVSTKNSGRVMIYDFLNDTWSLLTRDSTDFSFDRKLRVFDMTGKYHNDYTVKVNVHQENGDELNWHEKNYSDDFANMKGLKLIILNDVLYVFGDNGTSTVAYKSPISDGQNWTPLTFSFDHPLARDAYDNIMVFDDKIHIVDNGAIYTSVDGEHWTLASQGASIKKVVANDWLRVYALSNDNKLISSEDLKEWRVEELDENIEFFPTERIGYRTGIMATAMYAKELLVVGNRSAITYPNDTRAVVWRYIEEGITGGEHKWTYLNGDNTNIHQLPNMKGMAVSPYGEYIIGLGGKSEGDPIIKPYSKMYVSHDGGLTWKYDSRFALPVGLDTDATSVGMAIDKNNYIWMIFSGSGQIYYGRLNSMGWKKPQKEFK